MTNAELIDLLKIQEIRLSMILYIYENVERDATPEFKLITQDIKSSLDTLRFLYEHALKRAKGETNE